VRACQTSIAISSLSISYCAVRLLSIFNGRILPWPNAWLLEAKTMRKNHNVNILVIGGEPYIRRAINLTLHKLTFKVIPTEDDAVEQPRLIIL
tara:strand:- start:38 stop:316 length:279 start_codon:yes stop_codon:yes gene_type:complete